MKRTRIRPVSRRRAVRDRVYPAAREAVLERSGGRCEADVHADDCNRRCEQVHHREGRNVPEPHRLDNLVGLSAACHSKAHLLPGWAYETGISIRKHRAGGDTA